jgi:hypothetical protein
MNTSRRLGMAIVVAGGVSVVGPAPAIADTIYTYTGNTTVPTFDFAETLTY